MSRGVMGTSRLLFFLAPLLQILFAGGVAAQELSIIKGPYLQWPTQNAITIMWETSADSDSKVLFYRTEKVHSGLNGAYRTLKDTEKTANDRSMRTIHEITIEGLLADTDYHYQIVSEDADGRKVESAEHPFRTAPENDTPFCFGVTSESGGYGSDEINARVFKQMEKARPDFLLLVGDMVQQGSQYDEWRRFLFEPGQLLFSSTPFFLCPGNHEERSPWFQKFVSYPEPENYYSFNYANAHFIALDCTEHDPYKQVKRYEGTTQLPPAEGPILGEAQQNFLINDLESNDADWTFVFFHYPPYVSGDYQVEAMRELCPVFEKYGVNVVFNSHTIVYERSYPLTGGKIDFDYGVTYIVVGGCGEKQDWFHHKRAYHTAHAAAVPHFLMVAITAGHAELKAIDENGNLFDSLIMD